MAPEQKLRVVENLQQMGEIVAVTGDGVNDSPALKRADIGVAMGITGTDVAKEAADMTLTDDNFASIVHAIEEGRAVYANIRKFMLYILNSNVPEAVPSAIYLLSGGAVPLPLTTMQILTIDLGTDMLPALGLGTEPPEADVMANPPRNPNEPLLSGKVMRKAFLWYGMLGALFSFAAFMFCQVMNGWHPGIEMFGVGNDLDPIYVRATTMALAAIVFTQIGEVWNCRTETASVFSVGLFSNKQINKGILFEIALIIFITLFPPFQSVFHTSPLVLNDFVFLVLLPPVILLLEGGPKGHRSQEEPHRSQRRRHQAGTGKEVKMKVIVVGMGRMGTSLARKLDRQGYEVCAIDQDPERLKALGPTVRRPDRRGRRIRP